MPDDLVSNGFRFLGRRKRRAKPPDARDLWHRSLLGDPEALESLLRHGARLHPSSVEGRAVRRSLSRMYRRQARQLMIRARTAPGSAAATLRREANESFALAVLAGSLPQLVPGRPGGRGSLLGISGLAAPPVGPSVGAIDPAPDAPGGVTATVSSATSVAVTWTRPNENGKTINQYVVTAHDKTDGTTSTGVPVIGLPPAANQTFTGLTSGHHYRFTVRATNLDGTGPDSLESNEVTPEGGTSPPSGPQNVNANVTASTAAVTWNAPATGAPIVNYVVTPYDGAGNPISSPPAQTIPSPTDMAAFLALPNGSYRFGVKASNAGGFGPEARTGSVSVNVGTLSDFHPTLPSFSSDPVVVFGGPEVALPQTHKLLAAAIDTGGKWRYEYLKAQAMRAAGDTLAYEGLIAHLMEMALTKVTTAELLLNPTLATAISQIQNDTQSLIDLGQRADVKDISKQLGGLVAKALLLQAIITWLIEADPIAFWVGLFGKLIDDIASFDAGLPRTKHYLEDQFAGGSIGNAVRAAAAQLLNQAEAEVDRLAAPLKAAVAEIIGATSNAMKVVFRNFDGPLLMQPTGVAGQADVPDVNPLDRVLQGLQDAVEGLIAEIKKEVSDALNAVVGGTADLFRDLMIAFIVLPILAFLVVAAAGGPFSAAVLAAVVMIAAEELLHLLARWLTGPLLGKLDELKAKVLDTVGQLQQLFAQETALLQSPEPLLNLLGSELLELRDLLPEAFLDDAASLLGRARDRVMRGAIDLALAAEQALGLENATAFDAVSYDYATGLTTAPQLPGGADSSRLAGAALVADLDRLERQRTAIRDGKEQEVTHRLSLSRMLGGVRDLTTGVLTSPGQFATFLTNGQALVHLSEEVLLDRTFPGLYRALIKDVRVAGVFASPVPGLSAFGIPVTVTHLGESRTRVKRDANPAAPPTDVILPECLQRTADEYADDVLDQGAIAAIIQDALAAAVAHLPPPFRTMVSFTRPNVPSISAMVQEALVAASTAAIAARAVQFGCGVVDPTGIRAAAGTVLGGVNWASLPECRVIGVILVWVIVCPTEAQVRDAVNQLNLAALLETGLRQAAKDAYQAAVDQVSGPAADSVGKWGATTLVEDPDPQIRSLGFATLVRSGSPEAVAINLFRADQALPAQSAAPVPAGFDGLAPVTPPTTLQYRPFENRGLEGDLLVSFQPGSITGTLTDLVLEVTFRACYNSDLAATVKASGSQWSAERVLAQALTAANARSLVFPGDTPNLADGTTVLQTVHVSLRAHRDKLLIATLAAAEGVNNVTDPAVLPNPVTVGGITFDPTTSPLGRDEPFSPFDTGAPSAITLQFKQSANRPTSLGALLNRIPITPDDLGFPPGVLTSPDAELAGVGIAVIPNDVTLRLDSATIDAPLSGLLPAFGSAGFGVDSRLVMTTVEAPVSFPGLWAAEPSLTLDFGTSITDRKLYDVIFSLSVRVPVKATQTAVSAVT